MTGKTMTSEGGVRCDACLAPIPEGTKYLETKAGNRFCLVCAKGGDNPGKADSKPTPRPKAPKKPTPKRKK